MRCKRKSISFLRIACFNFYSRNVCFCINSDSSMLVEVKNLKHFYLTNIPATWILLRKKFFKFTKQSSEWFNISTLYLYKTQTVDRDLAKEKKPDRVSLSNTWFLLAKRSNQPLERRKESENFNKFSLSVCSSLSQAIRRVRERMERYTCVGGWRVPRAISSGETSACTRGKIRWRRCNRPGLAERVTPSAYH